MLSSGTKGPRHISEEMIHQAGFTICTTCNSVLVTARRKRCTTCTSSCRTPRTSSNSTKSSCLETSRVTAASSASPGYTEHSEPSQVSYSPTCISPMVLEQESAPTSICQSLQSSARLRPRHTSKPHWPESTVAGTVLVAPLFGPTGFRPNGLPRASPFFNSAPRRSKKRPGTLYPDPI